MNLIFLYGPPAAGKLTIANELVKSTGFKLFHNHLTQDMVKEIYPDFGKLRFGLVDKIRLDTFEYAAKNGTDLIFTFVYTPSDEDDEFVASAIKVVEENGGKVLFVQLTAPIEALVDRVSHKSRLRFGKISSPDKLHSFLSKYDMNSKVNDDNVLTIDTLKNCSTESANLIVEHFGLEKQ